MLAVSSNLTIRLLLFAFYAIGFKANIHDTPLGLAELHGKIIMHVKSSCVVFIHITSVILLQSNMLHPLFT